MTLKRLAALAAAGMMCAAVTTGCGDESSSAADSKSDSKAASSAAGENNSGTDTGDDALYVSAHSEQEDMRDISAWDLVSEMKIGWNLGNTFDATGGSGIDSETSWGNPKTTKEMIDAIKDEGFNVFRLPVTWDSHMDENYNVDPAWMARVHEVVDYAIDDGLFVILNTHHEEWYFPTEADKAQDIEQLTALWKQIAEEFKNYDEHLIFEGLNEPRLRGTNKEWSGGDNESREVVNEYEQAFYDTVRASGGNNDKRALMITGYAASSSRNCLQSILLPNYDDEHLIVSVHAYLPYSFALDTKGTDQFDADSDAGSIDTLFTDLDDIFLSNHIPVIVGEFGCMNKMNDEERVECVEYYLSEAKEYGVPCVWWDNGAFVGNGENFGLLVRDDIPPTWRPQDVVDAMLESAS